MRLHRFYTTEKLCSKMSYKNPDHIHQWKNVFRYDTGASIILFGDGFEHTYIIESISKKEVILSESRITASRIQKSKTTIALALIKRDNFELALQKCTEIGISHFIPLITDRSIQKMFSMERINKVLIEAIEQSGWGKVPTIGPAQTFERIVQEESCLVFDTSGEIFKVRDLKNKTVCIGPEGGWTERELSLALSINTNIANLKTGVLRAETAAILLSGMSELS